MAALSCFLALLKQSNSDLETLRSLQEASAAQLAVLARFDWRIFFSLDNAEKKTIQDLWKSGVRAKCEREAPT